MEVKYSPFEQHLCSEASTQSKSQQANNAWLTSMPSSCGGGRRVKWVWIRDTHERKIKEYFILYTYEDHCTRAEQTNILFLT